MENKITELEILRKRLLERRNFLNLTYQELADKTGISKSTLQRYEKGGIKNLPYDKFFLLAKALEVPTDYFTNLSLDYTAVPTVNQAGQEYIINSDYTRTDYLKYIKEFENESLEKITPTLIKEGYKIERKNHGSVGDLIATKGSYVWHFDFLYLRDISSAPTGTGISRQQILSRFGRLAVYNNPITKYSIVINSRAIANEMINRYKPIHLNIEISCIVLTDTGYEDILF